MPGVLLLRAGAQLQRVHLDDGRHHRALADELADLDGAIRHDARDRRADRRVVELLDRQVVRRAAVLQQRLLAAHGVGGRLVGRLGHLQPGLGRLLVGRRHDAPAGQRLDAVGGRLGVQVGGVGVADRRDLIVGRRVVAIFERPVHPELGPRLLERAFGAGQRELQFPGLEFHQRGANLDVLANLHQHGAHDAGRLGADPGLVGREERAGQVDHALDAHALHSGGTDVNGGTAPTASAARAPRAPPPVPPRAAGAAPPPPPAPAGAPGAPAGLPPQPESTAAAIHARTASRKDTGRWMLRAMRKYPRLEKGKAHHERRSLLRPMAGGRLPGSCRRRRRPPRRPRNYFRRAVSTHAGSAVSGLWT